MSGPLLDRIDLQIEVPAVAPATLASLPDGEPSSVVAARVAEAQHRQHERQGALNAALDIDGLDRHARLDAAGSRFLQAAAVRLGWSARAFHRVLRVARSVADLQASGDVAVAHVAEAIQYRRVLSVQ